MSMHMLQYSNGDISIISASIAMVILSFNITFEEITSHDQSPMASCKVHVLFSTLNFIQAASYEVRKTHLASTPDLLEISSAGSASDVLEAIL